MSVAGDLSALKGRVMATVKVIAGNLAKGDWVFEGSFNNLAIRNPSTKSREPLGKAFVDRVEALDEERVRSIAGTAAWGVAGAALLGPVGAVGAMLVGGKKKMVTFACYFEDGRKFMGVTDSATWTQISAAHF